MDFVAEDFLGGKLPVDMSDAELITAMREIMSQARTWSFNSDTAQAVWVEIDKRATAGHSSIMPVWAGLSL